MSSAEGIVLSDFVAARWLGHGRAIECYLACVTAIYGVGVLFLAARGIPLTFSDTAGFGHGMLLAVPLLMHSGLASVGLVGNIMGWAWSRWLRIAGAVLSNAIWAWTAAKLGVFLSGAYPGYHGPSFELALIGFAFALPAAAFSARVMMMALADLPRPGAPSVI